MNKKLVCLCSFLFFLLSTCCFFHLRPFRTFAEAEKSIYLTFDDGPSDRITPKILDVLREEGVRATFFVVGRNVETRKQLTRRILDEGNSVGIHSYSHRYGQIYASPETLLQDIEKCGALLNRLGIYTRLYRFPGGSSMVGENFKTAVRKKGYAYVDWNALCGDAEIKNPKPSELYERAIRSAGEKSTVIMLFHDSTDKEATLKALPFIIEHYKTLGYRFCTFDMA